jgi:hypothetical protein
VLAAVLCKGYGWLNARRAIQSSWLLYGGQVGIVLRCATCDAIQLRIARVHGQEEIDMQRMSTTRVAPDSPLPIKAVLEAGSALRCTGLIGMLNLSKGLPAHLTYHRRGNTIRR